MYAFTIVVYIVNVYVYIIFLPPFMYSFIRSDDYRALLLVLKIVSSMWKRKLQDIDITNDIIEVLVQTFLKAIVEVLTWISKSQARLPKNRKHDIIVWYLFQNLRNKRSHKKRLAYPLFFDYEMTTDSSYYIPFMVLWPSVSKL